MNDSVEIRIVSLVSAYDGDYLKKTTPYFSSLSLAASANDFLERA